MEDAQAQDGEGLRRAIGLPSAVLLVMGGMVGVGVFVNPAVSARALHAPALILGVWALGGLLALLGAFVYAELAARLPLTGGEYVYLRETLGSAVAFLFGWTTLRVVQAGGMAAVAIVFVRNLAVVTGAPLAPGLTAAATLLVIAGVNCLGVRAGNQMQAALGGLKIAAIAALVVLGAFGAPPAPPSPDIRDPSPIRALGAAIIPVVFSYGGWQTAAFAAGEIRDPARNLSRAVLLGVGAVVLVYLTVTVSCLRALGPAALGKTLTPASDVLRLVCGPIGAGLAAAAIALSALGFLSQSMLTAPRVYFAMARDGLFLPRFGVADSRTQAPILAILLQAAWSAVLALSGSYDRILSYVTAMNFLFFALNGLGLFILRRRGGPRPFFLAPWHPLTTGLFVAACFAVTACSIWSYPADSLVGFAILALGVPVYLIFRRGAEGRSP